jgi:hypothetical protein
MPISYLMAVIEPYDRLLASIGEDPEISGAAWRLTGLRPGGSPTRDGAPLSSIQRATPV